MVQGRIRPEPHERLNKALTFSQLASTKEAPCRGVEKLASRRAHNPKTVGSSPTPATNKFKGLDQKSDPFLVSKWPLDWYQDTNLVSIISGYFCYNCEISRL